jgi:hypothetical protein
MATIEETARKLSRKSIELIEAEMPLPDCKVKASHVKWQREQCRKRMAELLYNTFSDAGAGINVRAT